MGQRPAPYGQFGEYGTDKEHAMREQFQKIVRSTGVTFKELRAQIRLAREWEKLNGPLTSDEKDAVDILERLAEINDPISSDGEGGSFFDHGHSSWEK